MEKDNKTWVPPIIGIAENPPTPRAAEPGRATSINVIVDGEDATVSGVRSYALSGILAVERGIPSEPLPIDDQEEV